jgi:hypothetical protein
VFNTGFESSPGHPWDEGWMAGNNPPFYQAPGEGVGGTGAAKSDPYTTNGVPNDGPFTSNEMDTSTANVIRITFSYKVHQTNSPSDLKIAYSTIHNPDLSANSHDFNYFTGSSIGTSSPADTWTTMTVTIAKTSMQGAIVDPTAFTRYFSFRFESDLQTRAGGIVEQVWIDNVQITVSS